MDSYYHLCFGCSCMIILILTCEIAKYKHDLEMIQLKKLQSNSIGNINDRVNNSNCNSNDNKHNYPENHDRFQFEDQVEDIHINSTDEMYYFQGLKEDHVISRKHKNGNRLDVQPEDVRIPNR